MCISTDVLPAGENDGRMNDIIGSEEESCRDSIYLLTWYSLIKHEIQIQLETAIPTLIGMVLYKIPWLISLRFVGGIGAEELAAASLASTLCNVTGMSLSVGLSSALTTLTSQASGDLLQKRCKFIEISSSSVYDEEDSEPQIEMLKLLKNDTICDATDSSNDNLSVSQSTNGAKSSNDRSKEVSLPLVYLFRGLFVQLLFVIPVGLWWIYGIQDVLVMLGQGLHLSNMTEKYLRILAPGLWSYSLNWTLTAWLQALGMAEIPAYVAAIGLATHIPFNYLFIYVFNWGYLGGAAATVAFQLLQPLLILSYLFGTQRGRENVIEHVYTQAVGPSKRQLSNLWDEAKVAVTSISGISQYLGLAIPGIIAISEWWASEVSIFLSGRLLPSPSLALGSMTLYQSINTFCFMFPVAFGVAGAARVGKLLGADKPADAKFAGFVGVICAGVVSGSIGCILYFTPHSFFPSLFAPEEHNLIQETSKVISLLAIYVLGDGLVAALNGIIKGCGRQVVTMPIVLVAYWVIALPLCYYIVFVQHNGYMCDDNYFCGIVGLVTGMTTGTWIHMLLLLSVVVFTTNWELESKKAKSSLRAQDAS